jgi:proteic killer suppression protein
MAIVSFRHKGLKRLYEVDNARGVPADFAPKLRDMLAAIDTAVVVEDVALFPGWRRAILRATGA